MYGVCYQITYPLVERLRSVDVFSGSGEERQELDRLRREKERLVHQIGEQAVDIEFLSGLPVHE